MPRDPRAFLWDVREAGRAIQAFTAGMDSEGFASNPMAQASVERKFEIIGEATKCLSTDLKSAHPSVPWKRIAGFRDVLIHDYLGVDLQEVLNVVTLALPEFRRQIKAIVDRL